MERLYGMACMFFPGHHIINMQIVGISLVRFIHGARCARRAYYRWHGKSGKEVKENECKGTIVLALTISASFEK